MSSVSDPNQRVQLFVSLLAQSERRLNGFVLSLLPNWSDADDVLQTTKLKLWEQFGNFDPSGDFGAWARKIAFFEILTYRKRTNRDRARFSNETLEHLAAEVQSIADEADLRHQALSHCLQRLATTGRDLLWGFYSGQGTVKDLAIRLGRSVRGTQRAVARLLHQLQQCVEQAVRAEDQL
jgi:RNA polymerase sigma-70 factor, ECF subfamily